MSKPATPIVARLARQCVRDDSGCVLFTGHLDRQGYGRIWVHLAGMALSTGRKELAHRVAYEVYVGRIPDGYEIDHLCGVRNCVNPAHLEAVTPLVNTRRARNGNAAKTHCVNGHEFTPENTRQVAGRTARACRVCDREKARERRAAA